MGHHEVSAPRTSDMSARSRKDEDADGQHRSRRHRPVTRHGPDRCLPRRHAEGPAEIRSYEKSLERSRLSLNRPDRPREFTMLGRRWDLLDHVFAPPYSPSTRTAVELLGLDSAAPPGTAAPFAADAPAFLEVGSGAGVIAVLAALAGHRVSAVDVNEHAVRNTVLNAARHGVADRVDAVHGDLLAPFAGRRFDRIFWSSNYVLAPEEYVFDSDHERAYVDPGYRAHRRYLTEAVHHLTPAGRALLHFCDRGQLDVLTRIAAKRAAPCGPWPDGWSWRASAPYGTSSSRSAPWSDGRKRPAPGHPVPDGLQEGGPFTVVRPLRVPGQGLRQAAEVDAMTAQRVEVTPGVRRAGREAVAEGHRPEGEPDGGFRRDDMGGPPAHDLPHLRGCRSVPGEAVGQRTCGAQGAPTLAAQPPVEMAVDGTGEREARETRCRVSLCRASQRVLHGRVDLAHRHTRHADRAGRIAAFAHRVLQPVQVGVQHLREPLLGADPGRGGPHAFPGADTQDVEPAPGRRHVDEEVAPAHVRGEPQGLRRGAVRAVGAHPAVQTARPGVHGGQHPARPPGVGAQQFPPDALRRPAGPRQGVHLRLVRGACPAQFVRHRGQREHRAADQATAHPGPQGAVEEVTPAHPVEPERHALRGQSPQRPAVVRDTREGPAGIAWLRRHRSPRSHPARTRVRWGASDSATGSP